MKKPDGRPLFVTDDAEMVEYNRITVNGVKH